MKKILLLIGGLSLFLSTVKAQIPNAGFENWDTTNLFIYKHIFPVGWMSNNLYWQNINKQNAVVPSTDAHSGKYSMKMTVLNDTSESKQGASCGTFEGNLLMGEGNSKFPMNSKPGGFEFWYKFSSPKTEVFAVFINLYRGENQVGSGMAFHQDNKSVWSKYASLIEYTSAESPDSASVSIIVGFSDTPSVGTVFMIDDLAFTYPTALSEVPNMSSFETYPNPAKDIIHIKLQKPFSSIPQIHLKDISGRSIQSFSAEDLRMNDPEIQVNIGQHEPGIYLLEVQTNQYSSCKKIILE